MIKAEEEKENTHDPEYFLTMISFSQLASQFQICFFISVLAHFTGVGIFVVITIVAQVALGSWVREWERKGLISYQAPSDQGAQTGIIKNANRIIPFSFLK